MVKQRGMYQAKPPEQWLICWMKCGQPPPSWSLKSQHPPSEADLPEKITQLQGQFYHGLSSFPAELNKRWRGLKWLRHLLQWVGDSSGFRKNSGFFLAHRPIFQTVFSFDYSCFHFIWFPLSKIRSIKFKLYCELVKHSNTQRSLYWMQAICWGSLSAKHRLTKAARLTVLSHATVEHFPCLQLAIQDFFHLWMWLTAQRLLDTRAETQAGCSGCTECNPGGTFEHLSQILAIHQHQKHGKVRVTQKESVFGNNSKGNKVDLFSIYWKIKQLYRD